MEIVISNFEVNNAPPPLMVEIVPAARGLKRAAIRAGLDALYFSGAYRLGIPLFGGIGGILTFHRVRPTSNATFQPNSRLEITPDFLDTVIRGIRRANFDIVSLDELYRRLMDHSPKNRRFVALTFDDGYRDNLKFAWPVLKKNNAPFTVFVTSAFAEGKGELWWMGLESVIREKDFIVVKLNDQQLKFDCSSAVAKERTFSSVYLRLRNCQSEKSLRECVRQLARTIGLDMEAQCRDVCMDWSELELLSSDPLCTIGGHSDDHLIMATAPDTRVRSAMVDCARRIEAKLGSPVRHFAYPFGDESAAGPREFGIAADAGFITALTTRRGVLFHKHAQHPLALPRLPVNGKMPRAHHLHVLLSGIPTALANGFRPIDVA